MFLQLVLFFYLHTSENANEKIVNGYHKKLGDNLAGVFCGDVTTTALFFCRSVVQLP